MAPKRVLRRPSAKAKARPAAGKARARPKARPKSAAARSERPHRRPGNGWYSRWIPNWPWGRMAFLPQHLRLLSPLPSASPCAASVGADGLRRAMSYAGLNFEDRRISTEEFDELRRLNNLCCDLPVLLVGAPEHPLQPLWRVNTIARYVGKVSHAMCNLYPEDPVKSGMVDAVMDDLTEMLTADAETGMRLVDYFERNLRESKYGWVATTKHPSVADFLVASYMQMLPQLVKGLEDLTKYPQIVAHIDKVVRLEGYTYPRTMGRLK